MKSILVIMHDFQPEPDAGIQHLRKRGCDVKICRPFVGDVLPDTEGIDGVIIAGGPQMMTRLDQAPYLVAEMDFAMRIMDKQIPLLTICLGAQMIAYRLGAQVEWHHDGAVAFGYHQILPTAAANNLFPSDIRVLSGNAQGFELPSGANLLARGHTWENQAFSLGENVLAFQFHPEVTRIILNKWQKDLASYIGRPDASDIGAQDEDFVRYDPVLKQWYFSLLDRFFNVRVPAC